MRSGWREWEGWSLRKVGELWKVVIGEWLWILGLLDGLQYAVYVWLVYSDLYEKSPVILVNLVSCDFTEA
jgi:hypothetical protein